jgi:hypothetical protein
MTFIASSMPAISTSNRHKKTKLVRKNRAKKWFVKISGAKVASKIVYRPIMRLICLSKKLLFYADSSLPRWQKLPPKRIKAKNIIFSSYVERMLVFK